MRTVTQTAVLPAKHIDFMKLVWGSILGYFLFDEIPDAAIWIGGAVIVSVATYIACRESRRRASAPDSESPLPEQRT